jgi:DNA polymerase III alpha subunit
MISRGDIVGVFQLDSWGGQRIAQQVRPQSIEDIALAIALNRPGPLEGGQIDLFMDRKRGIAPVESLGWRRIRALAGRLWH